MGKQEYIRGPTHGRNINKMASKTKLHKSKIQTIC